MKHLSFIFLLALLPPLFHQVALHIADGGDRSTEPDRAQLQEVGENPAEPHGLRGFRLVALTHSDYVTAIAVDGRPLSTPESGPFKW